MRKIYFLIPDEEQAKAIISDLHAAGIDDQHIAILAKREQLEESLPEDLKATPAEKSDFIPALQRGVALGGAMGLFAGLSALVFAPAGIVVGGGAVLISTTAGATLGAWAASLIGISVPNSQLEQFESALERGEILMLIDLPEERIEEIQQLIQHRHPQAEFEGVEPVVKVMSQSE